MRCFHTIGCVFVLLRRFLRGQYFAPLAWIGDVKANRSQICVVLAFPLARDHPSRTSLIHTTPIWGTGLLREWGEVVAV